MRRGYTLIEIIITIAITGILSVGMFKAFEAITLRSEKAKILSSLSIDSQSALDQLSLLLYARAPMSVQGCDITGTCVSLETATNAKILQWYGTASESYQARAYSGFVDMNQSIKPNIYTPNTFKTAIENNQTAKWGSFDVANLGVKFAGTFEDGSTDEPYAIESISDNNIKLPVTTPATKIYEKYYLVDSAYAVTRKFDAPSCPLIDLTQYKDNDLLLYYNYRPWKNPTTPETLCDGNVSLLSRNVNAFIAHQVNGTIRLGLDMEQNVSGSNNPVRLSKQKVVF